MPKVFNIPDASENNDLYRRKIDTIIVQNILIPLKAKIDIEKDILSYSER